LPFGTVTFEKVLAVGATAVITLEPKLHPHEDPGMLRLLGDAISQGDGKPDIKEVELWPRCTPDGFVGRVGDVLRVDVTAYRPEKLVFARSVKIVSYRKLGRHFGVICEIPSRGGFGFIRPLSGESDIYFRTAEVSQSADDTSNSECYLEESAVKVNMNVSFEIITDESGSAGRSASSSKLRAIRVCVEKAAFQKKAIIAKHLKGVVVRECRKDAPGSIEIHDSESIPSVADDVRACHSELTDALVEFSNNEYMTNVLVENFMESQKIALRKIITEFPNIGFESVELNSSSSKKLGYTIRFWKMNNADYSAWLIQHNLQIDSSGASDSKSCSPRIVSFMKKDIHEAPPELFRAGQEVIFDLHLEKLNCTRVACNVVLIDHLVDGEVNSIGVMDGKYIRCIPSDERLMWTSSKNRRNKGTSDDNNPEYVNPATLAVNQLVSFDIRLRAGSRFASSVKALDGVDVDANPLLKEHELPEICSGIVVPGNKVIPIDISQCSILQSKIVDLVGICAKAKAIMQAKKASADSKASEITSWKKTALPAENIESSDDHVSVVNEKDLKGTEVVETVSDEPTDNTATEKSNSGTSAVFYPPLAPAALHICLSGSSDPLEMSFDCDVGRVIEFYPVVNWAVQRQPLKAAVSVTYAEKIKAQQTKTSANLLAQNCRVKGVITCLKINVAPGIECTEIAVGYNPSRSDSGEYYYCDSRELRLVKDHPPHQWDEVEFIPCVPHSLATLPVLVKTLVSENISSVILYSSFMICVYFLF
jgi:hypothetical protein